MDTSLRPRDNGTPTADHDRPRSLSVRAAHGACLTVAASAAIGWIVVAGGTPAAAAAAGAIGLVVGCAAVAVSAGRHREPRGDDGPLTEPPLPATDPLTGLIAEEGLDLVVATLAATGVPYSIAICDIDGLTAYNTEHGRAVGNHALRFMAEVLDMTFRPSDVIARVAGDEFVAVLAGVNAVETGAACARVNDALTLRLYDTTNIPHFRASFGVADTTGDASFAVTRDAARMALQLAKARGEGRVAIAGEEIVLSSGVSPL